MTYMVRLYKWERGYHPADESVILLHYDPARKQERGKTIREKVADIIRRARGLR